MLSKERIDAIVQRHSDGGAEIVKHSRPAAHLCPSAAAVEMAEAILKDKKKVFLARLSAGEYASMATTSVFRASWASGA